MGSNNVIMKNLSLQSCDTSKISGYIFHKSNAGRRSNNPLLCRHLYGFTLIELLVVIAIISLLVSILLPSLQKAKGLARQVVCLNDLRNINSSFSLYHADSDGIYPPYKFGNNNLALLWYCVMEREGYFPETGILLCPASQCSDYDNAYRYNQGFIDHGYNIELSIDYSDPTYPLRPAQIAEIGDPAGTITVLDTLLVRNYIYDYMTELGRYYCFSWYSPPNSPGAPGTAVARHDGRCGVAWSDGHVSMVAQSDPEDASSLYDTTGLTDRYDTPNYWDRK